LHWFDGSEEGKGFWVERSSNGIHFEQVAILGAEAPSYVDNDVAAATRYYNRVRAFNGRAHSRFTEVRDVTMW
jgi:hypothetical protein